MRKFAEGTVVPADKSRTEIERALQKFGADQFGYGWRGEDAVVFFRARGRHVRFVLPMPSGMKDGPKKDQEIRRRWRALYLCIKAKLESVATEIETFEDSFMAQTVMPTGQTMSEHAQPLLAKAYETGKMPPLLPFLKTEDTP